MFLLSGPKLPVLLSALRGRRVPIPQPRRPNMTPPKPSTSRRPRNGCISLIAFILSLFTLAIICWGFPFQFKPSGPSSPDFPANRRPEAPHAHDYENFVYFTAELEDNMLAHEVAHHLGLEYLHQVGELTQHHLFRKPLLQDGVTLPRHLVSERVLGRVTSLTEPPSTWKRLLRRDVNNQILAQGIRSVLLQEPKKLHRRSAMLRYHGPVSYNATAFRELGIKDPGFKNQWHFVRLFFLKK